MDDFDIVRMTQRKPLRDMVYDALRKGILQGEIHSGKRLVEETLARKMGASRTPVREALQKLEQENLVCKLPKGGFAVNRITRQDIEEIFGIRSVLESYAAYLATQRADEKVLEELEKLIRDSKKNLEGNRRENFIELNTRFHDILYRSSKSKRLYQMILNLRDHFYRFRSIILKIEGMPRTSYEDHRKMLVKMRKGDAKAVEKLVRDHILRGRDVLLKEITRGRISL